MRPDHGGAVGALHHRVVERAAPGRGKGGAVEAEEAEIAFRLGDAVANRRDGRRIELLILVNHRIGAENEIAGVPHAAIGDQLLGSGEPRLLDETRDAPDIGSPIDRFAGADIAIGAGRTTGRDAEGDQRAALGSDRGIAEIVEESVAILD